MKEFIDILKMFREIKYASQIKSNRNFNDFFSDRIIQSVSEPNIIASCERLTRIMNVNMSRINHQTIINFLASAQTSQAMTVLSWMRKHPRVVAMLTFISEEDFLSIAKTIIIDETPEESGIAPPSGNYEISVMIKCISPLSHGGDTKAGNATLFRRCQVLSTTGSVLELPFYGGNTWRGIIRDLLADHFLRNIGITPRKDNPPIALWFFHSLYAGGVLEEGGKSKIEDVLGKNGIIKTDGISNFRKMLPALSMLGCAIGNRVLQGRSYFGDLRPRCKQWGTGDIDAATIMEWTFITRREDHESHMSGDHHGMIANTETLKAGTCLDGGIDTDTHISDLEMSALGRGLCLLRDSGYLGGENRRGLGRIEMEIENCPDPAPYDDYLKNNYGEIVSYLNEIGAVNAHC